MTVTISSLEGTKISRLISSETGLRLDPKDAEVLEFCQSMSIMTWTGYVGDVLICCWGLIPPSMLSRQAYLWMHSTPAVRDHAFCLVRHSQRVIEEMLKDYDKIVGHCREDAADSIRWLRWLGAEFSPAENGLRPFVIRRKLHG